MSLPVGVFLILVILISAVMLCAWIINTAFHRYDHWAETGLQQFGVVVGAILAIAAVGAVGFSGVGWVMTR